MQQPTFKAAEVLALKCYFEELWEEARNKVKPGKHDIECSVSLVGRLKVGVSSLWTPTPQLSGLKLAASVRAALLAEGWTHQKVTAFLTRVIAFALTNPTMLTEEDLEASEHQIQAIQRRLKAMIPAEPRRGQVTFKGMAKPRKIDQTFRRARVV